MRIDSRGELVRIVFDTSETFVRWSSKGELLELATFLDQPDTRAALGIPGPSTDERIGNLSMMLRRALKRMEQYEMDVDDSPPLHHRKFMEEVRHVADLAAAFGFPPNVLRELKAESEVEDAD